MERRSVRDEHAGVHRQPGSRRKVLDSGPYSRMQTGAAMANCCCAGLPTSTEPSSSCPVSHTPGKPVDLQTVKSLLCENGLRRLRTASPHRFCPEPDCDAVYFDEAGSVYRRADIRVRVWEKEPFGSRVLCYCFGENEADIQTEIMTTGRTDAVTRVRDHIAAGRCACEVRNPRGVCCLGDLMNAVKRLEAGR